MGDDIIIRFLAIDMVSRVAERAGNAIDRMAGRIGNGMTAMGRQWMATGAAIATTGLMFIGAAAGMAAASYDAIRASNQFQSDLVMVATHAGLAHDQVQLLGNDLLSMAPQVGFGPDALAQAFYHVQSVVKTTMPQLDSLTAKEEILRQAAELAAVGHADLTTTVNTLLGVMVNYQGANLSAAAAAGALNAIVGAGNMTMQQFASAMSGGLLAVAAQAGVKLDSLGAAMGTLTDESYSSSRAATYLRSAIIQMSMPSGPAAKALEAIGLSGADVAKRMGYFNEVLARAGINQTVIAADLQKTGSLSHVLNNVLMPALVRSGLSGHDAAALIEKSFGGIRSGAGIIGLTNNLQGLSDKEKLIQDSTDNWGATWRYFQSSDPAFVVKQLGAGFDSLRIVLGHALTPAFFTFAGVLGHIIQSLIVFTNTHQHLIGVIVPLGIALLAALGIFLTVGGALIFISGATMAWAGAIVTIGESFGALVGIGEALAPIGEALGNVWAAISLLGEGDAFLNFFDLLLPELLGLGAAAGPVAGIVVAVVAALVLAKDEVGPLTSAFSAFNSAWQRSHDLGWALYNALRAFGMAATDANDIGRGLASAWALVAGILGGAGNAVSQAFHQIADSIPKEDMAQFNAALGQLGAAFVNYLLPVLEVVGVVIAALIGGSFQALVQGFSIVIPAAIRVFTGVMMIVAGIINLLGATFGGFVKVVQDLIHGNWAQAMEDQRQSTHKMRDAVVQIWNGLVMVVEGLVKGMVVGLMVEIVAFVDGFIGVLAQIPGPVGQQFRAAKANMDAELASMKATAAADGSTVGSNFANGIAAGIHGGAYGIMNAAMQAIHMAKDAADGAQQAASPSRLMRATTGRWFGQGIELGILDTAPQVQAAAASVVTSAAGSANEAVPAAVASSARTSSPSGAGLDDIHTVLVQMLNVLQGQGASGGGADNSNLLDALLYALQSRSNTARRQGLRGEFAF